MRRTILFCLAISIGAAMILTWGCKPDPSSSDIPALSEKLFANPPLEARPGALWAWLNGYVDKDQITKELQEMKAKGMRGAIIWDVGSLVDPEKIIPAGPAFMGKESIEAIHWAMDVASDLGLELGLFASSSWNAGGAWIGPEDASKALVWSETPVDGPRSFNDVLPLPEKTGKPYWDVAVLAVPANAGRPSPDASEVIDLGKFLDGTGRLNWEVPKGSWKILRFVGHATGQRLECPSPNSDGLVIDHLSRKAVDNHLAFMLNALKGDRRDLGPLKYFFFDSYEVWEGTDWTGDWLKAFTDRYGYDPLPYFPALAGQVIGTEEITERARHDFLKCSSDLIIENHFRRANGVLNRNGIKLIAEAGHGGAARVDVLKAMGAVDIPMGEFWNHERFWVTKEAASAAHIYGKKLVPAESLTGWQHWKDGPLGYKRLIDIAFCAGLNQVTFHTFAHNPPEAGRPGFAYHAGEHFNVNSTWWNFSKPMLDYLSRCCTMLQQGQFVADVCLYYGDQAPNLVPSKRIDPSVRPVADEATQCLHCGKPRPVQVASLGLGYDYDYVNEEVLVNRMRVENGRIVLPDGLSYRLLVLPDRTDISPAVLGKIEELVKAGAVVVGRKPDRSNSLKDYPRCDEVVKDIAARVWGPAEGEKTTAHAYGQGRVTWGRSLREVLADMGVGPDFTVENIQDQDQHIDYIHRRTGKEDYYFISNSSLQTEEVSCKFRVEGDRAPFLWDPADGSISRCYAYEPVAGGIRLTLTMAPASSIFVVFKKDDTSRGPLAVRRAANGDTRGDPGSFDRKDVEILSLEGRRVTARIGAAGTYQFENAQGLMCSVNAESMPPDILLPRPWKLAFPKGMGAPGSLLLEGLISWTDSPDPGVKYFSGTASYSNSFVVPEEHPQKAYSFVLDLGKLKEVAEVFINGKSAGILWKEPFRVDITRFVKPGDNALDVAVTNLWNNRIVGDLQPGNETAYARTNMKKRFSAQTPLISSGLLGPVKISYALNVRSVLK
jgi:hypothetical protein